MASKKVISAFLSYFNKKFTFDHSSNNIFCNILKYTSTFTFLLNMQEYASRKCIIKLSFGDCIDIPISNSLNCIAKSFKLIFFFAELIFIWPIMNFKGFYALKSGKSPNELTCYK